MENAHFFFDIKSDKWHILAAQCYVIV